MSEYLPDPDPTRLPPLEAEDIRTADVDHRLFHIYATGGDHPVRWDQFRRYGPTTSRFDHHPASPRQVHPDHGVWYGGLEGPGDASGIATSVAEVFQESGIVSLTSKHRWLAIIAPARRLDLLSLDSSWITRAGGNAAIGSGERAQSQKWARAISRHYRDIEGLTWSSSVYPPGTAIVLWERRKDPSPFSDPELNRPLRDLARVLVPAANEVGYQVSVV